MMRERGTLSTYNKKFEKLEAGAPLQCHSYLKKYHKLGIRCLYSNSDFT